MLAALVAWLAVQETPADRTREAVEKTGRISYAYRVEGRFERSGVWMPDSLLLARIDRFQSVRLGETTLVKGPEGLWKTPDERIGEAVENERAEVADMMRTLGEARAPHRMAAELLSKAAKVAQGDDVKVDGRVPCRVYYLTIPQKIVREELEQAIETGVKKGRLARPDSVVWKSVAASVRIYVRAEDGLVARVVERSSVRIVYRQDDGRPPVEKKFELKMTVNLSDFGAAKAELPDEVMERLRGK